MMGDDWDDEGECGCCELHEYEEPLSPDTDASCLNCLHTPEEHGL